MCTNGEGEEEREKTKAESLIEAISIWFIKEYKQTKPPTDIPDEMLRKGIITVTGFHDRRTINSRIDLLKAHGLIKKVSDRLYHISYNITEKPAPAPKVGPIYREV